MCFGIWNKKRKCAICRKWLSEKEIPQNHVKAAIQQNFKYFILNSSVNNVLWNLKPKEKEKGAICRKWDDFPKKKYQKNNVKSW